MFACASRPVPRPGYGPPAPGRSMPSGRAVRNSKTRSVSTACRTTIAALNAELAGQAGEHALLDCINLGVAQRPVRRPEGQAECHATSAGRELGTTVVALNANRLEQPTSLPPKELLHLLRGDGLRQKQGQNPL